MSQVPIAIGDTSPTQIQPRSNPRPLDNRWIAAETHPTVALVYSRVYSSYRVRVDTKPAISRCRVGGRGSPES